MISVPGSIIFINSFIFVLLFFSTSSLYFLFRSTDQLKRVIMLVSSTAGYDCATATFLLLASVL